MKNPATPLVTLRDCWFIGENHRIVQSLPPLVTEDACPTFTACYWGWRERQREQTRWQRLMKWLRGMARAVL